MRIDSYEVQGDRVVAVYVSDERRNMKQFRYEQARPHGEWRDFSNEGYVECPFCEHATTCDDNIEELHFCFFCGAAMRKKV